MPDPVLWTHDLGKSYGHHVVIRDVSFTVAPGTLVGIVGENGAGKSTLLKMLAGELRPSHGDVFRHGALGYCPQTVVLNESLSVAQHLDYFRAAYGITDLTRANHLVAELDYAKYREAPVASLSGGTKQKLNLTIALMHSPTVLLLDEPYQGFDWETYRRFWQLASELRDGGCAVLVVSHLLFDQERFDVIFRLRDGQLQPESLPAATAA